MKKRYAVASAMADVLVILLVPANLFLVHMKEWVMLIGVLLILAALGLFYFRGKGGLISKLIFSIFAVFSACFCLFGSYCNPYWNSVSFQDFDYTEDYDRVLSYEQAKEDLDFAMHYLKKNHPLFIRRTPEAVGAAYDEAVRELQQAEEITVTLLHQKMQKIFSALGDGHTTFGSNYRQKLYLADIGSKKQEGYTLAEVNGRSLRELLEANSSLYSYEVESWGMEMLKNDLSSLQGLWYIGISADEGVEYTWENQEGERITCDYTADDFVTYEEYMQINQAEGSGEEKAFVSYEIDEDKSLAVMTLTACRYNEEYIDCVKEMFTEVKEKNIRSVAVDIRENGGGNSLVVNEFIRYLDVDSYLTDTSVWRLGCFQVPLGNGVAVNNRYEALTFDGELYLLTSVHSFSSAMMFAEYVKDNQLGTIIGEAPGNTPAGYGDIAVFQTPNSRLLFQVSGKEFMRADKNSKERLVEPDFPCDAEQAVESLYGLL